MGSASIPEIALVKRTNQQGVCKIAVFAYDRMSGRPVWQSGNRKVASRAKDIWVMGTGPFQQGTIYDGTSFAGEKLHVPLVGSPGPPSKPSTSSVAQQKVFPSSPRSAPHAAPDKVEKAAYTPPLPPPVALPPPLPPIGPQGNLTQQPVLPPTSNPAATTAGAIQTFNWAKELYHPKQDSTPP